MVTQQWKSKLQSWLLPPLCSLAASGGFPPALWRMPGMDWMYDLSAVSARGPGTSWEHVTLQGTTCSDPCSEPSSQSQHCGLPSATVLEQQSTQGLAAGSGWHCAEHCISPSRASEVYGPLGGCMEEQKQREGCANGLEWCIAVTTEEISRLFKEAGRAQRVPGSGGAQHIVEIQMINAVFRAC